MADVVQVELVGGSWLDALPFVAIVVSLLTLGSTIWVRERDRARLQVVVTSFKLLDRSGTSGPYVAFEATNRGLTGSTVVTGFRFRAPKGGEDDKRYWHVPDSALPTAKLPVTLHPGESVTWVVRVGVIAEECSSRGISPRRIAPFCETGHRSYKGRWRRVALEVVEAEMKRSRASGQVGA